MKRKYAQSIWNKLRLLFVTMLLTYPALSQQNLIINGGFETHKQAPQGQANILRANGGSTAYDDLPNWYTIHATPDFLATDGAPEVNPSSPQITGGMFQVHSGIGCVGLARHNGSFNYDEFIGQQLSQSLIPGNAYRVEFYALRRPGPPVAEKLSVNLIAGNTAPSFDTSTGNGGTLLPKPVATLTTQPIRDDQQWTPVSGILTIPANAPTPIRWIVIGYDRSRQGYDYSLSQGPSDVYYAIDDISLVDLGCAAPETPIIQELPQSGCYHVIDYKIVNFDPALTYTVNNIRLARPIPVHPTYNEFTIKTNANVFYAEFSVTVTNVCGLSTTTDVIGAEFICDEPTAASTAYPNPANETLSLPADVESATLINDKGKMMQTSKGAQGLNVRNLPEGLYNLQIRRKGKIINQRIQINH